MTSFDEPDDSLDVPFDERIILRDVRKSQKTHSVILRELEKGMTEHSYVMKDITKILEEIRKDQKRSSWDRTCEHSRAVLDKFLQPDVLRASAQLLFVVVVAVCVLAAILHNVELSGWGVRVGGTIAIPPVETP